MASPISMLYYLSPGGALCRREIMNTTAPITPMVPAIVTIVRWSGSSCRAQPRAIMANPIVAKMIAMVTCETFMETPKSIRG
jgi:hypothetical protein